MVNLILIVPIMASFLITLFLMPSWIRKSQQFKFVGKDMNKYEKKEVSEGGGIIAVTGFILGILIYIAIKEFFFNSGANLVEIFSLTTSLLILAMIGLTDGSLGWKAGLRRKIRITLCFFAAVPLMVINAGQSLVSIPLIGEVNLGLLYPLIFIPLGVIGATTTFNFLAGFNGLEAGQGIIIISFFSLISYFSGYPWLAMVGIIIIASLLAFMIYNFYPARVFPGDVLTYPLGGIIAIMAILGNFEKIAVLIFIPYIIEFILKSRGKLIKQSFATPKKDGSLDLKYDKLYSLNHVAIYLMKKLKIKSTEKRVVYAIWAFQILISVIFLIIFRKGIF